MKRMGILPRRRFQLGLERCLQTAPDWLQQGARFGLLFNQASVDGEFRYAHQLLDGRYPGQLKKLFSPQHGLWGEQQANMIETPHALCEQLGLPIYSLYSEVRRPTAEMLADLDVLVVDLQDVGCRIYTFIWTLLECLHACAEADVRVLILDRPNPLGGLKIEGPPLDAAYRSFVGGAEIPMRHGLTIGECGRWLRTRFEISVPLEVVPVDAWDPSDTFPHWGREWLCPSPNLPAYESTRVYPGQVLLEGTNLSEGRGTTRPFEQLGAPFVDSHQWLQALEACELPGVVFRETRFVPTFDKWKNESCQGLFLHVTDETQFDSYRTTVALLRTAFQLWPQSLEWLDPPYEYETRLPPIDILSGSDRLRRFVTDDSVTSDQLAAVNTDWWWSRVESSLLYPRT